MVYDFDREILSFWNKLLQIVQIVVENSFRSENTPFFGACGGHMGSEPQSISILVTGPPEIRKKLKVF